MTVFFLSLEDILEIHTDQIERYGGRIGVRDQDLLLSAIAQPSSEFDGVYLHPSLHDMAAAYLFHICQNHPFIDGNKRVALVSALVFLDLNNELIDYDEDELETLMLSVASGNVTKEEISTFLSESRLLESTPSAS